MELWQIPKGIFMNKGKYIVEIFNIFDMLDCKSMTTPMDTNLKLLSDESLELVDVNYYYNIIELVIYLTNTSLDI